MLNLIDNLVLVAIAAAVSIIITIIPLALDSYSNKKTTINNLKITKEKEAAVDNRNRDN